jgi:MYXO-CTERM domain-containing protein
MKKILSLFALIALSATLSFAQTPDRSAPNDNNVPASNEPVHRGGNFGWIGLIGLAGLAGMRGRREDVRGENVRVRPAA